MKIYLLLLMFIFVKGLSNISCCLYPVLLINRIRVNSFLNTLRILI
jgi:hypothetical protein